MLEPGNAAGSSTAVIADMEKVRALAEILEDAIQTHPGNDGETITALAMIIAQAIGSFPPVQRPAALAVFMNAVVRFLEVTP